MPPGIKMEIESRDLTKNTAVHNVTILLAICICVIVVRYLLDGYHREEAACRSDHWRPPDFADFPIATTICVPRSRNRYGQISKDRGFDVDAHTTARELREEPGLATECLLVPKLYEAIGANNVHSDSFSLRLQWAVRPMLSRIVQSKSLISVLVATMSTASVIAARQKTWFEFFFIPVVPLSSKHIWLCTICQWRSPHGPGQVEPAIAFNPGYNPGFTDGYNPAYHK
ncbi:hypothetical protein F5146DRAFT_995207 [Armillaria mellea]|nr:hypothetical protein F5146DRAFT_995207 [Armillaria mellea]